MADTTDTASTSAIAENETPNQKQARLRREINNQRSRLQKSLESLMRSSSEAIQDAIVTQRNDRYVIPDFTLPAAYTVTNVPPLSSRVNAFSDGIHLQSRVCSVHSLI